MNLIEIVPGRSAEHKRRTRQMGADVIPRDKSWQVLIPLCAAWIAIAVLFVRWWTI